MKPAIPMSVALAMCDVTRARRTEPKKRIDRMNRDEQRRFWRRPRLLDLWKLGRI